MIAEIVVTVEIATIAALVVSIKSLRAIEIVDDRSRSPRVLRSQR